MDDEIARSRARVTRRRAISLGGVMGLGTVLAACGRGSSGGVAQATATPTATATPAATATAAATGTGRAALITRLDVAPACGLTREATEGPYWFDADAVRRDVRENRPGARLDLALRVQDRSACAEGGEAVAVPDAVVEIWHCDAGGDYSGFQADGRFLRGAQATDDDGLARFTTIWPGWYQGRTVHVHLKVHVDSRTVLTAQLYFDDAQTDAVLARAPYDGRGDREVRNDADGIFDPAGVLAVERAGDGWSGVLNLGVDA